ncbi:MAG: hypothetical protein JNK76_03585 [Planctomycetales bacterium]|nr:hypothetical protein [Planctomycetales bacterium]MBN8628668.1 hypothetical protein [Planctomycetota bacterium]
MNAVLNVAVFSVTCLLVVTGCGRSETEVHRDAILKVLQVDKSHGPQVRASLKSAPSLADAADAINRYCDEMDKLDMSQCPADFRLAFRQHIRSWRSAGATLLKMPDGFWDGLLMGTVNTLTGELDGGMSRLASEYKQAEQAIKETYNEAERIAAQYGAVL